MTSYLILPYDTGQETLKIKTKQYPCVTIKKRKTSSGPEIDMKVEHRKRKGKAKKDKQKK